MSYTTQLQSQTMSRVYGKFLKSLRRIRQGNNGLDIAVALSGGVDSVVLLNLLVRYKNEHENNLRIHALTVDHGLRVESSDEAKEVALMVEKYPITHRILQIQEKINRNQLEKHARELRYGLMYDYCEKIGIRDVYMGHHLDDQVETFSMRLLSGSTLFGLMGMRYVQPGNLHGVHEVDLVRPMLDVSKEEIYEYARDENLKWFEDSTNADTGLTKRNKLRDLLSKNEQVKTDLIKLHEKTCKIMYDSVYQRMNSLKVGELSDISATETFEPWCMRSKMKITYNPSTFLPQLDSLVIDRWLFNKIWRVSPHVQYLYGFTKFDSVHSIIGESTNKTATSLFEKLISNKKAKFTLAGCIITSTRSSNGTDSAVVEITVSREKPHRHTTLKPLHVSLASADDTVLLDGRYFLTGPIDTVVVPTSSDINHLLPNLLPKRELWI